MKRIPDSRGFYQSLIGDGRPLISFTGLMLVLSGGFALFLSATGHFLPHDVAFLGMTPEELCAINECRIVHFMIHDRVAFGGVLIAIGAIYMWLSEFPLRAGEPWAWWTLLASGAVGFGSFLSYLGYGYLDTWHGATTLILLPCFAGGMLRSYLSLPRPKGIGTMLTQAVMPLWRSAFGIGRACLLATAVGLICAGLTIMLVGMTVVFVPQDLSYMGLGTEELQAINPNLVPLIAHDRAGFGGGVCTVGILIFLCVWCAVPSRSLWQVLCTAGIVGFGTAIGIHPMIGYNDFIHLAPAYAGALTFAAGLVLTFRPMYGGSATGDRVVAKEMAPAAGGG